MPPSTRRTSAGPTASKAKKAQQTTLAFKNKVSKPSAKAPSAKEQALTSLLKPEADEPVAVEEISDAPTTADISLVEQVVENARAPTIPEEEEALKMSEAHIKKYWKAKEEGRKFPRVHQEDLPLFEKVCRDFDTDSRFGVSACFQLSV
jgi:DNA polymerase delta subunit 4